MSRIRCEACSLAFSDTSKLIDHLSTDEHKNRFVKMFGFSDDTPYPEFSIDELMAYKKYIEQRNQQSRGHYTGVFSLLKERGVTL